MTTEKGGPHEAAYPLLIPLGLPLQEPDTRQGTPNGARGCRQIDLAEQAGISENYVSDLELGRKEVCLRALDALSRALATTIPELLKGVQKK